MGTGVAEYLFRSEKRQDAAIDTVADECLAPFRNFGLYRDRF